MTTSAELQDMDERRYADFSLRLHNRMVSQRVPADASIEVTRRCPLNCAHCYNNLPMGDAEARRGELTREEHFRLLDEMAEAGCLWILYTGGEIFARPDFLDIYTYAKKKGFLITLFTNGTLITPEIADYLVEWRPFGIEITIYGATPETHDRLTRAPGSYERAMRGIRLLLDRGLPLKLKTMATTINKHEVGAMKRFAEGLGCHFRFDAALSARVDCSTAPLAFRLEPSEIVQLDLEHSERVTEWQRFCDRFCGAPESNGEVYRCGAGMFGFAIDPEGRLSPCVLARSDTYDLREGSFREGWDRFLREVRARKVTRVTKCTACSIQSLCGMCPANGELENSDAESPVDFLCRVAHLRAKAMNLLVPPHGDCEYCAGSARPDSMHLAGCAGKSETPSCVKESL